MRVLLFLLFFFVGPFPLMAQPAGNNELQAAEADEVWQNWPTVGEAKLSKLWFDIYKAQLRTPDGQYHSESGQLALVITYLRDISAKRLLSATHDQWLKIGYSEAQIEPWMARLTQIFPSVKKGDQLIFVSMGTNGQFWQQLNNASLQPLATIEDASLDAAFMAIWLSEKTQYPDQRKALTGAQQ